MHNHSLNIELASTVFQRRGIAKSPPTKLFTILNTI